MDKNIVIDEAMINVALRRLIDGLDCKSKEGMSEIIRVSNPIYAGAGQTLDASKLKGSLVFEGRVLRGGIYKQAEGVYTSDDMEFSYKLDGCDLLIKAVCSGKEFKLSNFDSKARSLGIHLSHKPTKEIAIVVCTAASMDEYVFALKEVAPYLANHLFSGEDSYAKVTLAHFSNFDADDLGTFYKKEELANAISKLKTQSTNTRMLFLCLIRALENFTKDNGLRKEVYLISDGRESDSQNAATLLPLTKNLNRNIYEKSRGCDDNCVAIHCFSINENFDFLRELAAATGGNFYHATTTLDFKTHILSQSSGGHFDRKELGMEIKPSKTEKIHDHDHPGSSKD